MGEQLGAYETLDVLGEGGSAIVYAARAGGEDVALKVLREAGSDRQKERFLGEARPPAKIDHPNAVRVIDAGTLPDGRPYLALPRPPGRALAARAPPRRL